ncbi:MAG: TrgA family protein [Pseudomonadota bacterium]
MRTAARPMPTAARLFAAAGFATMAFFATELYKPLLPEGTQMDMFTPVNVIVGALCGWLVMGRLAGTGYYAAAGSGVRTSAVMLFYVLFIWSFWEMFQRSIDLYYDGPVDALQQMMELGAEYFLLGLQDPQVPITVLIGGILAAFFSEWASQQWA